MKGFNDFGAPAFHAGLVAMRLTICWPLLWVVLSAFPAFADESPLAASIPELREAGYEAYQEGNYAEAAASFGRALEICEQGGHPDPADSAWLCSDLAEMHRLLGKYRQAEALQRQAIELSRRVDPPDPNLAAYLSNLAALQWDFENFGETERLLREVRGLLSQDERVPAQVRAVVDLNLGVVLRDQGRPHEARPFLDAALSAARTAVTDSLMLPYFLSEPASLYAQLGNREQARLLWTEALALVPPTDGARCAYRAQILLDMAPTGDGPKDAAEAVSACAEAVALRRRAFGFHHPDVGAALARLAARLEDRDGPAGAAAAAVADSALAILADSPAAMVEQATALGVRARWFWANGQADLAVQRMKTAVNLIESLRPRRGAADTARLVFLQRFRGYFEDLIAWQIATGDAQGALAHVDALRARILSDRLEMNLQRLYRGVPAHILDPLLEREEAARTRLVHIERSLATARTGGGHGVPAKVAQLDLLREDLEAAWREHQAVQSELRLHSPAWRGLRDGGATLDLSKVIREIARPGRIVLIYHIGDTGSWVFSLRGYDQVLQVHELVRPSWAGSDPDLSPDLTPALLDRLLLGGRRAQVATQSDTGKRGVAGAAYVDETSSLLNGDATDRWHVLWGYLMPNDLWSSVKESEEVVIVPSGKLDQLPFDALVVEPGPRYWLDEGPPIRIGRSLSLLLHQARDRDGAVAGRGSVLSVCDPLFGDQVTETGSPWAPLPGTRLEAESLQAKVPASRLRLLSGAKATEGNVRREMVKASWLHVATHGTAPRDLPWRAGLVLAADERDTLNDGVLRRHEIAELDLSLCDLAVLSSCHTGAAHPVPAEGVFALAQAFQVAGVRQTVSALWAVDDQATAVLMGAFFGELDATSSQDPDRVSRALQEAKKLIRSRDVWASPRFWAAFVCEGGG